MRILTEPGTRLHQFREIFRTEGVELDIEKKVFEQIAEIAYEYKTGARSLRAYSKSSSHRYSDDGPTPDLAKVSIPSLFTEPSFVLGRVQ